MTIRLSLSLFVPFKYSKRKHSVKLSQVIDIVDGIALSDDHNLELEVFYGAGADLMSDALRFGREDTLLITGLTNPQVIRTAEMVGIRVVLFVRSKLPPPETLALAREADIVVLATRYTMYEASGLLYQAGLAGLGACGDYG
jgi:hypothetical protein